MPLVTCDERGRILIPKEMRQKLGTEFHLVKAVGKILLIPVIRDPIKTLAEMGKKADFEHLSIQKIKEEARRHAEREA